MPRPISTQSASCSSACSPARCRSKGSDLATAHLDETPCAAASTARALARCGDRRGCSCALAREEAGRSSCRCVGDARADRGAPARPLSRRLGQASCERARRDTQVEHPAERGDRITLRRCACAARRLHARDRYAARARGSSPHGARHGASACVAALRSPFVQGGARALEPETVVLERRAAVGARSGVARGSRACARRRACRGARAWVDRSRAPARDVDGNDAARPTRRRRAPRRKTIATRSIAWCRRSTSQDGEHQRRWRPTKIASSSESAAPCVRNEVPGESVLCQVPSARVLPCRGDRIDVAVRSLRRRPLPSVTTSCGDADFFGRARLVREIHRPVGSSAPTSRRRSARRRPRRSVHAEPPVHADQREGARTAARAAIASRFRRHRLRRGAAEGRAVCRGVGHAAWGGRDASGEQESGEKSHVLFVRRGSSAASMERFSTQ